MGKIGRNQPCPCGSGKKYKHCCLVSDQGVVDNQQSQAQITLMAAIEKLQQAAEKKETEFFELGVFIFFSNSEGHAWLFEATEQDAVQVAEAGSRLEVPVEENKDTIEMNWSHMFVVKNKQVFLTDYADKIECRFENAPVQQINAAMKRVKKRYSQAVLDKVHLPSVEA